jgi:hypothetical protein
LTPCGHSSEYADGRDLANVLAIMTKNYLCATRE